MRRRDRALEVPFGRAFIALAVPLTVAALTAAQFPTQTGSLSADQQEIVRVDRLLLEAAVRGDVAELDRLWTADVIFIGNDGRIWDKARRLESFRSGQRDNAASTDEDVHIRVYGDTAVLMKTSWVKGVLEGRAFNSKSILTRVYVKQQGRWLLSHQHSSRLEQK
jgi:ketosteroid isomerase-like protein